MIPSRSRATFRFDLLRGFFFGLLHTWVHTFGLLVLIEYFNGPDQFKSIIFSSSFLGMFLSPFYGSFAQKWISRKGTAIAFTEVVSGLFLALSAFSTNVYVYTIGISLAFFMIPMHFPILSSIYHDNFPSDIRGKMVSTSMIVVQLVALLFTWLGGLALDASIEYFRPFLFLTGLAMFACAWHSQKIPTRSLANNESVGPIRSLKWLVKDPLFGYVIAAWFIFGFANLWTMPMRLKYLSSELGMIPSQVALLHGVIPELMRTIFTPIWGRIFDRVNFILLRVILNFFLLLGILLFFVTDQFYVIAAGSVLYGIGVAGGRVSWSLWTTKMVPPGRTAEYMAVHVAMTGVRGMIGPYLGFVMLASLDTNGYQTMGFLSATLIGISILMLVPVVPYGRREIDR